MKKLVHVGLIALVACSVQARSQEIPYPDAFTTGKPTVLHGQGGKSCESFIDLKQPYKLGTSQHYQDMAWVMGFLHAIDMFDPYTVKSCDYNGLDIWLEEYCRKDPIDLMVNAANKFYSYVRGRVPMSQDYSIWKYIPSYRPQK